MLVFDLAFHLPPRHFLLKFFLLVPLAGLRIYFCWMEATDPIFLEFSCFSYFWGLPWWSLVHPSSFALSYWYVERNFGGSLRRDDRARDISCIWKVCAHSLCYGAIIHLWKLVYLPLEAPMMHPYRHKLWRMRHSSHSWYPPTFWCILLFFHLFLSTQRMTSNPWEVNRVSPRRGPWWSLPFLVWSFPSSIMCITPQNWRNMGHLQRCSLDSHEIKKNSEKTFKA